MRALWVALIVAAVAFAVFLARPWEAPRRGPANVLFIVIDDLNDWVRTAGRPPPGAHPQPERLARRGRPVLAGLRGQHRSATRRGRRS